MTNLIVFVLLAVIMSGAISYFVYRDTGSRKKSIGAFIIAFAATAAIGYLKSI